MKTIYLVQHVSKYKEYEDVKIVGIFETEQKANNAIRVLRMQPGFSAFPDGFFVDEYEMDEMFWREGFGSL